MTEAAQPLPEGEPRLEDKRSPDQPDWRVSADEGAEFERQTKPREANSEEAPPDPLRLMTSSDLSESVQMERPQVPSRSAPPAAEKRLDEGPKPWTAAASSVPRMKISAAPPPPADSGADFEGAARPARAKATITPLPMRPARPSDDDEESLAPPREFQPGHEDEEDVDGFLSAGAPKIVALPVRKLDEPIWVVAMDWLQANPKVMVLIGLAIVLVVSAWIFWPRSEKGVSLHDLRSHAARYDGQTVRLNGHVGEVFNVGAGWAFNLHQGRDTIVVFTRGAAPRTRDRVTIVGSVSTGYLDGLPRQAIFATP